MSISGPFAAPELCRTGHVERRGTFALKRQGSPALSKAKIEAAMGIRKRDRAFLEHIRCRHSHCAQRARMHAPLARRPRCPCSQSGTERACHGRQAVQQCLGLTVSITIKKPYPTQLTLVGWLHTACSVATPFLRATSRLSAHVMDGRQSSTSFGNCRAPCFGTHLAAAARRLSTSPAMSFDSAHARLVPAHARICIYESLIDVHMISLTFRFVDCFNLLPCVVQDRKRLCSCCHMPEKGTKGTEHSPVE